jgi:hypothetical protein
MHRDDEPPRTDRQVALLAPLAVRPRRASPRRTPLTCRRFDKKYFFGDPAYGERVQYVRYWQNKLASNENIAFPDALVKDVASATDRFSFAYLKEAFVSTLFMLATQDEGDHFEFESLLKANIRKLRKALDDGKKEEDVRAARALPQEPYLLPPLEGKELEAQRETEREARDLKSVALAMAGLGRRFIY